MNCEEFQELKDRYLKGEISAAEESDIESHLENCSSCRELLDKEISSSEAQAPRLASDHSPDRIDARKQQAILRRAKYKNRVNIALFLLGLFIILNIAGSLLSSLYYTWGGEDSRLYRTQKTAALVTEFTFPNVTMPIITSPFPTAFTGAGWGHSTINIKPYFAAHGNYALQKKIGKQEYGIGQLDIKQFFSSMNINWQWQDNSYQDYLYFYHPQQLQDTESGTMQFDLTSSEPIWQALEILPEGTVAEMSLSFKQTYSIQQVKDLLSDYDLDITWYAIATGLETNPQYDDDRQSPQSAFRGVWGVPDLSSNMLRSNSTVRMDDASVREEYLLESMEFLMQNEKTAQRVFRGPSEFLQVEKRYKYIQENGINVYGVVVTGPTKELLKLKELDLVHSPGLGEIKLWNWFSRNFEGQMY